MESQDIDLNEFLCLKNSEEEKFFNRGRTLRLLELYKKYKPKVGSYDIKSMKKLWELIARIMSNEYRITILPVKCENRFKVLERSYKKIMDNNNNKTGRGRKEFEYEKEMDDIFEKKKDINPSIVLSSMANSEATPQQIERSVQISIHEGDENEPSHSQSYLHDLPEMLVTPQDPEDIDVENKEKKNTQKNPLKRKIIHSPAYKKRNDILQEMANTFKIFYEKKDKREECKLDIERAKLEEREKRTKLAREYLDFLKQEKTNDK